MFIVISIEDDGSGIGPYMKVSFQGTLVDCQGFIAVHPEMTALHIIQFVA